LGGFGYGFGVIAYGVGAGAEAAVDWADGCCCQELDGDMRGKGFDGFLTEEENFVWVAMHETRYRRIVLFAKRIERKCWMVRFYR